MKLNKQLLIRALLGGLAGLALMLLGACFVNSISILGSSVHLSHLSLVSHGTVIRFGSYPIAVLAQSVLMFSLGSMAGMATLPFAEDGKTLVLHSLLHFSLTAVIYSLLLVLCFDLIPSLLPGWLAMLLALYLVVWLGRYVGWYVELIQIRSKLGLDPGPSLLKWRETLPYLIFLVLLCDLLPPLTRLCDPIDVPFASGILLPFLLLPVGCFSAGYSLGKRQGFCPLYPLAAFVLYLPTVFLLFNSSALYQCFLAAGFALTGNLLGCGTGWMTFGRKR